MPIRPDAARKLAHDLIIHDDSELLISIAASLIVRAVEADETRARLRDVELRLIEKTGEAPQ